MAQATLEFIEDTGTLATGFDQWVALADAHPVYALAQVVHIFQMLHPQIIKNLKVNIALYFAHHIVAEALLLRMIMGQRSGFKLTFELISRAVEQFIQRGIVERKNLGQN